MSSNTSMALSAGAFAANLEPRTGRGYRLLVGTAIVVGLAGFLYAMLNGALFAPVKQAITDGNLTALVWTPSVIIASLGFVMLALRTLLWFAYRPFPSAQYESAPTMTVVIPAYNEGAMVEKSIDSVATARYPRDRLEILVVDDGSKDDTWDYIERAAARYPGLVTAVKLERNQGKRVALATGFRAARGSILITIDSDSVIDEGTLLAMAGPFRDPRVGAVAGKVVALNRDRGLIPSMLHVRYALSFDFQRSVESTYRTVYCCPGALAGYRASVVREVLEPWLKQRFLGARCTYGEDRALTNAILDRGFDTVYQGSAVVHTLVPESYTKLCKMYLRWDRSYVREEIRFARIVWKRPLVSRVIAVIDKALSNLQFPVAWTALLVMAMVAVSDPMVVPRVLLAIGIGAGFYTLYYLYSERSYRFWHGILYSYFSFFALWWIFPYAILTVRSRSWMTR